MGKIWELGKYKDNIALADEFGYKLTYGELHAKAYVLADCIGKHCLVFCLCKNEIGSILGYVSFINNGIVPVLLNAHLEEELLHNLL